MIAAVAEGIGGSEALALRLALRIGMLAAQQNRETLGRRQTTTGASTGRSSSSRCLAGVKLSLVADAVTEDLMLEKPAGRICGVPGRSGLAKVAPALVVLAFAGLVWFVLR